MKIVGLNYHLYATLKTEAPAQEFNCQTTKIHPNRFRYLSAISPEISAKQSLAQLDSPKTRLHFTDPRTAVLGNDLKNGELPPELLNPNLREWPPYALTNLVIPENVNLSQVLPGAEVLAEQPEYKMVDLEFAVGRAQQEGYENLSSFKDSLQEIERLRSQFYSELQSSGQEGLTGGYLARHILSELDLQTDIPSRGRLSIPLNTRLMYLLHELSAISQESLQQLKLENSVQILKNRGNFLHGRFSAGFVAYLPQQQIYLKTSGDVPEFEREIVNGQNIPILKTPATIRTARADIQNRLANQIEDLSALIGPNSVGKNNHGFSVLAGLEWQKAVPGTNLKEYAAQDVGKLNPKVVEGLLKTVIAHHKLGLSCYDYSAHNYVITSEGKIVQVDLGESSPSKRTLNEEIKALFALGDSFREDITFNHRNKFTELLREIADNPSTLETLQRQVEAEMERKSILASR